MENSGRNQGDIIGLDANVLIDMAESGEFIKEIKEEIKLGVLQIFTTNIALGEARHVLTNYRGYEYEKATEKLKGILGDFGIKTIQHQKEGNELAQQWLDRTKKEMYIHKFSTFPNDLRIIANLFRQKNMNVYITEDRDIEKAVRILKLPIKVRLVGEASFIEEFKIKEFFKKNHRPFHRKKKLG